MDKYFKNHPDYLFQNNNYNDSYQKLKSDLQGQNIILSDSDNVLEIWFWKWNFANYCNKIWVKNYTGIDIDDFFIKKLTKNFKKYIFTKIDLGNFFKDNKKKYNVIFTSHVFEHLDTGTSSKLVDGIYKSLEKWWIWINIMPNADSVFNSTSMRYCDITHMILYNSISFVQKINSRENVCFNIQHYNDRATTIIRRMIHIPFKFIFKILYLWMMQKMPTYYTSNLISVLKKED